MVVLSGCAPAGTTGGADSSDAGDGGTGDAAAAGGATGGWTEDELCAALLAVDPSTLDRAALDEQTSLIRGNYGTCNLEAGEGGAGVSLSAAWDNDELSDNSYDVLSGGFDETVELTGLGDRARYVSTSYIMGAAGVFLRVDDDFVALQTISPDDQAIPQDQLLDAFGKALDALGVVR
ncbi:hypothetical protein D7I47_01265 [Protaetiibacter intestinalis]|uniref:DUF3558 domain-containing protein n=1 Tax=Protaetiibacter intestinalis TaxID=2419774 RepID=A0A387B746_9MICO|nr:hypothetical protein D7I47_01265 [Protaetiibacter intestinalis]